MITPTQMDLNHLWQAAHSLAWLSRWMNRGRSASVSAVLPGLLPGSGTHERKCPLFIWSPLASGFFSGRFRRDNLHLFGAREWDEVAVRTYASEANFQRLDRANLLADKKGLTAAQVALAYVMNQPMNVFAVVGPHSAEKFEANIQASEVKLTPEEMDWLDLRTDRR
jgi:aryl-alcohol dehydrogenase-like predicted oxidoreductase